MEADLTQEGTVTEAFAELVAKERERLTKEGDSLDKRIADLEEKRTANRRELAALDAYEAAKSGTVPTQPKQRKAPTGPRAPRRTGIRAEVLKTFTDNTEKTSAQVRAALGIPDADKQSHASVAQALAFLVKEKKLNYNKEGRTYQAVV